MPQKLQLLIRTPVVGDTGALARIHLAAFKKDRLVRLMYNEANHWKAADAMIERRCSQAVYGMKMAKEENANRIVGWLCYSIIEPDMRANDDLASLEWTTAAIQAVEAAEERLTKSSGRPDEVAERDRRRRLSKAMSHASTEAFSKFPDPMRKTEYIIINTLVTDFAFQGRGVGSELLCWAISYADSERLAIWAQVSPAAYGLFTRAEFEEVHRVVLDLDDFAYNGVAEEHRDKPRWGDYEIKYMVRQARNRPEVDHQLRPKLP